VFITGVKDTCNTLFTGAIGTSDKLSPVSLLLHGGVVDIGDYAMSRILICSMKQVINFLLATMTPLDKYQPSYTLNKRF
jgi:hypothetical protein